jgi:hypothetical protein
MRGVGKDCCTAQEAREYRQKLHEMGAGTFVFEYITKGQISARKLCTAFGVRIPKFLEGLADSSYYQLLGHAISRELNKRRRLHDYKTIDDAAKLLREKKNIMVITGAGVSGFYVLWWMSCAGLAQTTCNIMSLILPLLSIQALMFPILTTCCRSPLASASPTFGLRTLGSILS